VLTVHRNPIGVPAGCRLIFRPQTILIRRRCISTTKRVLSSRRCRVFLRRQRVLRPGGRRFRFSPPRAHCTHLSLPFLLFLHPDIYPLLSYILYTVLCMPIHNVYFYILIYSFPFFAACTLVQSASCCLVSYAKYLARSPASICLRFAPATERQRMLLSQDCSTNVGQKEQFSA
jgi:hypothetical protein